MTDYLAKPAFVVGEIDEDLNLSLPPTSGEEYIKRVVIEAQKCADIVVADIDRKHFWETYN
uniref:Survival of motor neuron protein-interacting protein 1 n=1 Tax=Apis cerana TaxID=7461 RepID=V9IFE4_APICE